MIPTILNSVYSFLFCFFNIYFIPGLNGDQCLSYFVLGIGNCTKALYTPSLTQVFPLSPKSTLRWLGFSDEGSLCSVDSAGSLRLLTPSMLWRPICLLDERVRIFILSLLFTNFFTQSFSNTHSPCTLCIFHKWLGF